MMMILDLGAPCSLVGKEWLRKYLSENGIRLEDLEKKKSEKKFRFGPSKVYRSEVAYKMPIVVKTDEEIEVFLEIQVN